MYCPDSMSGLALRRPCMCQGGRHCRMCPEHSLTGQNWRGSRALRTCHRVRRRSCCRRCCLCTECLSRSKHRRPSRILQGSRRRAVGSERGSARESARESERGSGRSSGARAVEASKHLGCMHYQSHRCRLCNNAGLHLHRLCIPCQQRKHRRCMRAQTGSTHCLRRHIETEEREQGMQPYGAVGICRQSRSRWRSCTHLHRSSAGRSHRNAGRRYLRSRHHWDMRFPWGSRTGRTLHTPLVVRAQVLV